MGDFPCDQLAAGDPLDFSPSVAASAAGGRGIDGSRRVHSLGVRGLLAGGAVEVAAWPERLLVVAALSSVLGGPVDALGRSVVAGASAALRGSGVPSLELVAVVAASALVHGVLCLASRCKVVLLLKSSGSLQARCAPSSVDAVGFAEEGWRFRSRLRRETATALWRRLEADGRSAPRFWRLRQMDHAAFQQGWSRRLLWCVVCLVVPCLPCVVWILLRIVCVCYKTSDSSHPDTSGGVHTQSPFICWRSYDYVTTEINCASPHKFFFCEYLTILLARAILGISQTDRPMVTITFP